MSSTAERDVPYDGLPETIAGDEKLRQAFEERHGVGSPEEVAELLIFEDEERELLRPALRPEMASWIRDHAEELGRFISEVVCRAALRLAGRILVDGLRRPRRKIPPAERGTRTDTTITASMSAERRTLIELAAEEWNTPAGRFAAEALYRYRREVEGEA